MVMNGKRRNTWASVTEDPRTIGIIGARGTVGVFHPALFRVVDVLVAFDIRD